MMHLNSRSYQNLMLTLIAGLLLVLAAQSVGLFSNAQAQSMRITREERDEEDKLIYNVSNPSQAAATEKVAAANREIANQLGEVADAIREAARTMKQGQ